MTELSMLSKHKLVKAILVVLAVFATVRCADQNVDPGKCIREERYQIPVEKTFQEAYSGDVKLFESYLHVGNNYFKNNKN